MPNQSEEKRSGGGTRRDGQIATGPVGGSEARRAGPCLRRVSTKPPSARASGSATLSRPRPSLRRALGDAPTSYASTCRIGVPTGQRVASAWLDMFRRHNPYSTSGCEGSNVLYETLTG